MRALLLASVGAAAALDIPLPGEQVTKAAFDELAGGYAPVPGPRPQDAAAGLWSGAHRRLLAGDAGRAPGMAGGDENGFSDDVMLDEAREWRLAELIRRASERDGAPAYDIEHVRRRLEAVITRISDKFGPAPKDDEEAIDLLEDMLSNLAHTAGEVIAGAATVFADSQLPK